MKSSTTQAISVGCWSTPASSKTLDLADVLPLAHPYPLRNVFREDVAGQPVDRDEVLTQAPAASDGQFEVPPRARRRGVSRR